ncbi:Ca2+ transporter [Trichoderma novae-zelandiae]
MRTTNARRGRLSSRPFYTTVLLMSVLAAYSFWAQTTQRQHHDHRLGDSRDGLELLRRSDDKPECRQVHTAKDKCAFVMSYCHDEDAGLLPYLQLYYCRLGKAQPFAFVLLVTWLGLLFTTIGIAASDFFSVNLSTIATILGLSESLAGVTFLAFGNGSPDVFSTFAAMGSNSASMAVGELIGAASFITGVVAGSMALVREFRVDRRTYARDICFFIVAVAFTMGFLADGKLLFWECCAMIGYYALYVVTVVGWHWYTTRRKRMLRREGEARSHFYGLTGHSGDELAGEPYRDEPDEVSQEPERRAPSTIGDSILSALERGPIIEVDGQAVETPMSDNGEETDEDHERMVAAEVTRSMRVLRPQGKRRNTITPIRPSLIGALEFRSALAHLQRESNHQLSPIPARSYSENHVYRGRRGSTSAVSDMIPPNKRHASTYDATTADGRERARSHGTAPVSSSVPEDLLISVQDDSDSSLVPSRDGAGSQRTASPAPSYQIDGKLAPPPIDITGAAAGSHHRQPLLDTLTPRLQLQIPSRRGSLSSTTSPVLPFPHYSDSPMPMSPNTQSEQVGFSMLPPSATVRESPFAALGNTEAASRPVRWWPYSFLPAPHVLLATLFPTLQGWKEKALWDKLISVISVPSIFLLVITLPVVEPETSGEAESADDAASYRSGHGRIGHTAPPISLQPGETEPENEWERFRRYSMQRRNSDALTGSVQTPLLALPNEDTLAVSPRTHERGAAKPLSEVRSISQGSQEKLGWNRWLVCLQLFTGPLFVVFIIWANLSEDWEDPQGTLVRLILWTLLGSLVLLAALLLLTSEQKRPDNHFLFCFLGFIISIAWISTVAGEVVGVLKTFGVVLGISEALLGLTIFAAGNSVGDLVADITVARLGYPVMALSACFGGPMLNILLGIGVGGVLMMVQDANRHKHKHPGDDYAYQPYRIQIGGTLMISSITLLVILVGLLISVPLNKWILSRRIGWALIAMWSASTIANVVVEVTGVLGDIS